MRDKQKVVAYTLLVIACLFLCVSMVYVKYKEQTVSSNIEELTSTVGTLSVITYEKTFIGIYEYILYDPDTKVMYSVLYSGEGLSITPRYNQDGTLRVYNPE